jgi:hypothetical protein
MAAPGVSNKPMVATAARWLNENPFDPMRRHIGQPLGSFVPDLDSVGGWQAAASWPGVRGG